MTHRGTITQYVSHFPLDIARRAVVSHARDESAGIIALTFSAIAVEAVTNEILHYAMSPHDRDGDLRVLAVAAEIARIDSPDDRSSWRSKIAAIARSHQRTADFSRAPLQDLHVVFQARNYLVHLKPQLVAELSDGHPEYKAETLTQEICRRADVPSPIHPATRLPTILQSREVGRWAYNTAIESIGEINSWLGGSIRIPPLLFFWLRYKAIDSAFRAPEPSEGAPPIGGSAVDTWDFDAIR